MTDETLPAFGPIIEASRDDDDAVFVKLAQHRLTWGEAVMRLKDNRTRLRASVVDRGDQVLADLGRAQQEQLGRRTRDPEFDHPHPAVSAWPGCPARHRLAHSELTS